MPEQRETGYKVRGNVSGFKLRASGAGAGGSPHCRSGQVVVRGPASALWVLCRASGRKFNGAISNQFLWMLE